MTAYRVVAPAGIARVVLVSIICVLGGASAATADLEAAGPEVDRALPIAFGADPAVTGLPDGGFVIAYRLGGTLMGARFDASGVQVGLDFSVSADVADTDVAADAGGNYAIVWESTSVAPTPGVKFVIYDDDSQTFGSIVNVSDTPDDGEESPRIAMASDGSFVVAWYHDVDGAVARRFDASGTALGPELVLGMPTDDPDSVGLRPVDVALLDDGTAMVVWEQPSLAGGGGILARRLDALGAAIGPAFTVNSGAYAVAVSPLVAPAADGGFLVMWLEREAAVERYQALSRRFDSVGDPVGFDVAVGAEVAGLTASGPRHHALLSRSDGTYFYVGDPKFTFDPDSMAVGTFLTQALDADGATVGDATPVSERRFSSNVGPVAVAGLSGARAVVVWGGGRYFQRFCDRTDVTCDRCPGFDDTIDVDADGVPDGCDLCVNVGGSRTIDKKPRLFATEGSQTRAAKVRVSGQHALPFPFSSLHPDLDGITILVKSPLGAGNIYVRDLGKNFVPKGTNKWTSTFYHTVVGKGRIILTDKTKAGESAVKVRLTHTDAREARVRWWDGAPTITVQYGDETAGPAGFCGEATFSADGCKFSNRQKIDGPEVTNYARMKCR